MGTNPKGDFSRSGDSGLHSTTSGGGGLFDVFNLVPQSHEKALKQALYNTVALILVGIIICAATAVRYILEPFLRPLLWALLFGSVLHPFKRTLTATCQQWLTELEESGTPIIVGLVALPLGIVDRCSDRLGGLVVKHARPLAGVVIISVALAALYNLVPANSLTNLALKIFALFNYFSHFMDFFNGASYLVWSLVIGYFVLIWVAWTPERRWLAYLGPFVWSAFLLHLAGIAGPLRMPLLFIFVSIVIVGWITKFRESSAQNSDEADHTRSTLLNVSNYPPPLQTLQVGWNLLVHNFFNPPTINSFLSQITRLRTFWHLCLASVVRDVEENDDDSDEEDEDESSEDEIPPSGDSLRKVRFSAQLEFVEPEVQAPIPGDSIDGRPEGSQHSSSTPNVTPKSLLQSPNLSKIPHVAGVREEGTKLSNLYLQSLFWACVLVEIWRHPWFFHLLPIPIIYVMGKTIGSHFGVWGNLSSYLSFLYEKIAEKCESRREAFIPSFVREGLIGGFKAGDAATLRAIRGSLDVVASVAVMIGVGVAAAVGATFLAAQIYGESVHLVGVASSLVNRTLVNNPDILPESFQNVQSLLDSMLGDAYFYSRQWIASSIHRFIDDKDPERAALMEKQILELWDRVYHQWVAGGNATLLDSRPVFQRQQSASFDNLVDGLKTLNLELIASFVQENIGILMTVVDSIWTVIKGNISLAFSAITAILSLLFGGGTAVLNFFINFCVFSTALFYLLCGSGDSYKPLEMFTQVLPSGNKIGQAVEESINGVFAASFKMAAFYGLYTWLTHTVFDVKVVYMPAVLSAICGAVPFLGPYWTCLPAVLELWLVQGQVARALLMVAVQLAPTSFVDSAIYAEIKGGHPYLTGLAIAGGIFCFGFEGALFGPLLLCFFCVLVNLYSGIMKDVPLDASGRRSSRMLLKRMFTID